MTIFNWFRDVEMLMTKQRHKSFQPTSTQSLNSTTCYSLTENRNTTSAHRCCERLPSNLRPTTREWVHLVTRGHFRSRDRDGGHTIRSAISENHMLYASLMALCFMEPQVASPGFAARRSKDGNYVTWHSRWTSGPGAAAARWLIVLW